jgi:hypothetical protein
MNSHIPITTTSRPDATQSVFDSDLDKLPLEIRHLIFEQLLQLPRTINLPEDFDKTANLTGTLLGLASTCRGLQAEINEWYSTFNKNNPNIQRSKVFGYVDFETVGFVMTIRNDCIYENCKGHLEDPCLASGCPCILTTKMKCLDAADHQLMRRLKLNFHGEDSSAEDCWYNWELMVILKERLQYLEELEAFCYWNMEKGFVLRWQRSTGLATSRPWVPTNGSVGREIEWIMMASKPKVTLWYSGNALKYTSHASANPVKLREWYLSLLQCT